jgi:hypothetical protein
MKRLGYERYVSQGGDWGAFISEVLQRQAPEGLLGIHINFLFTRPLEIIIRLSTLPSKVSVSRARTRRPFWYREFKQRTLKQPDVLKTDRE